MDDTRRPGRPERLSAGLTRLLAPNPSPMTERGTNSYLVGETALAVIDPGPDDPAHLAALLEAIGGREVSAIVVTHAHLDHSALAPGLAEATGAPVLAFGGPEAGRSAVMIRLAAEGLAGGGEGVDRAFRPERTLADGERIAGPGWTLDALHMPGHMGNHLCLAWNGTVFTGDLVMGWASSLVSPPDGDLTDFMASCRRLQAIAPALLLPGHGAEVTDPAARLAELIAHREGRERAILAALAEGPQDSAALVARLYADTPTALHPAARRNVFAHLVDLTGRGLTHPDGPLGPDATYRLAG